jgi:hypothetical protein
MLKSPISNTYALLALATAGVLAAQAASAQAPRPRANDAYKPADQGAGLGVLNSDGSAAPAPAFGSPPPRTEPSYVGGPPSYNNAPPPSYSGAPAYGAQAPSYSQSAGSPPPYAPPYSGSQYRPAGGAPSYGGSQPYNGTDSYRAPADSYSSGGSSSGSGSGFGEAYTPPSQQPAYRNDPPPPYRQREHRADSTYSSDEIKGAGHSLFGSISQGLASAIEHTFRRQGRPNGYILGEEGGGAFIAGLRYGQGTLFTKDAGSFPIYWQGPSLGFDAGAAGSKTMILVYNLRDTREIYDRFGGIDGSAYVVGGVGVTLLGKDHITMAPIRSGVGLRLGANVGYLKFSHKPTWNPF